MDVTLRYFDGCPNWRVADERLKQALSTTGHDEVRIKYERVETGTEAERLGFIGSPTVLVNDRDPFEVPGAPSGLACRIFTTPEGLAGSPTVEQLRQVIATV